MAKYNVTQSVLTQLFEDVKRAVRVAAEPAPQRPVRVRGRVGTERAAVCGATLIR